VYEEALFDQEIKTDSANCLVYNIRHDLRDDDAQRFISGSWIYVDTLKRKVFDSRVNENQSNPACVITCPASILMR